MPLGDDDTLASDSVPASAPAGAGLSDTELVAGRYRIVRWLGGGGMGRVYEAFDSELDERVALKVLRSGLSPDAIERFRREVKLTRRIVHRNVCRMFDIGEHGGDKFLTMELVDGEPLSRLVGEPLAWAKLSAIADQLCAGLAAAHAAGVVHRDLKPDNVLIERGTARAVITDFGIARGGEDPSVTQVGALVGTPRYMAPEQLAGKDVDARTDIFALGVMLFELATGTRPWPGDTAVAIAVAQATSAARTITAHGELPAAFVQAVAACLQLDPARRPRSAAEVAGALAGNVVVSLIDDPAPRRASPPTRPPALRANVPAAMTQAEPTSLAVLPVACAAGDEYLADGVLDDLIDTLSTTPGLRVRPAGLVRAQAAPDPREVGRALAVDHVVAATLRRAPAGGLKLAARLIGVVDGFQIWAHREELVEGDILAACERMVTGIAGALSARAQAAERVTDPRAVELYLRGRAEQRRFWGANVQNAAELFARAGEIAPSSEPILAAYALACVQAWVYRGLPALEVKAREALERALPTGHGEAFLASAQYHFNHGDHERGARDLGTALVRAPMSAYTQELAAHILVEIDGAAARPHYQTAAGLDPLRGYVSELGLARLEALEGDFASADARIAKVTSHPDSAVVALVRMNEARLAGWRYHKEPVLAALRAVGPRLGGVALRVFDILETAFKTGVLDINAWQREWRVERNPDIPLRQQLMGIQILAESALVIGNAEVALDALEAGAHLGLIDVLWLDHCPLIRPIAEQPRFVALRAEVATRAAAVLAAFRSQL